MLGREAKIVSFLSDRSQRYPALVINVQVKPCLPMPQVLILFVTYPCYTASVSSLVYMWELGMSLEAKGKPGYRHDTIGTTIGNNSELYWVKLHSPGLSCGKGIGKGEENPGKQKITSLINNINLHP